MPYGHDHEILTILNLKQCTYTNVYKIECYDHSYVDHDHAYAYEH